MVLGLPYPKEHNFVDVFLNFKEEKMKKKFKLFATIGSLCLAVAMMTIGVLAAAQANLTVSSNVTFEAANVNASYAVEKVEPAATWADPKAATTVEGTFDGTETVTFTGKLSETNKVAGYVVTIKNNYAANQTINIEFTDVAEKTGNGWTVTSNCPASVAAGETVVAYVYVTIDPANIVDGTNITLDSAFTLTLAN